jgi:hypothetical protein
MTRLQPYSRNRQHTPCTVHLNYALAKCTSRVNAARLLSPVSFKYSPPPHFRIVCLLLREFKWSNYVSIGRRLRAGRTASYLECRWFRCWPDCPLLRRVSWCSVAPEWEFRDRLRYGEFLSKSLQFITHWSSWHSSCMLWGTASVVK